MKKVFTCLLAVVLALSLISCRKTQSSKPQENNINSSNFSDSNASRSESVSGTYSCTKIVTDDGKTYYPEDWGATMWAAAWMEFISDSAGIFRTQNHNNDIDTLTFSYTQSGNKLTIITEQGQDTYYGDIVGNTIELHFEGGVYFFSK